MSWETPLRRSRIRAAMRNGRFADLRLFGVVSSTNDLAARLFLSGAAPGLVVIAEGQTDGRGRRGTPWISTPGTGLFASVLVEPPGPAKAPLLAGAAGIAAARAIRSVSGAPAAIKWPNDLWIDEHKVGGILIEISGSSPGCAIVGVGITLVPPPGGAVAPGATPVSGVLAYAKREVSREALAASLLDHLDDALTLAEQAPAELKRQYRELDVISGRDVLAETPEGVISGRVADVDLGEGIDLIGADHKRRRLRAEHTHILLVRQKDSSA